MLSVLSVAAVALVAFEPSASASAPSKYKGFLCFGSSAECEQQTAQAKTPEEASKILKEKADSEYRESRTSQPVRPLQSGYGYTIVPGTGGRYYGWRFSRNLLGGRELDYSTCVIGPGGVTCRYTGTIRAQAQLNFNGRQVTPTASMIYETGPAASPGYLAHCDEKGFLQPGCGDREDVSNGLIYPGESHNAEFGDDEDPWFYLEDNSDYDVRFRWTMQVPTYTPALSRWYDSLDFQCPEDDVCNYPEYEEGDSS